METLKLIAKSGEVYAEVPVRDSVEQAQIDMFKKLVRMLKLKQVLDEGGGN